MKRYPFYYALSFLLAPFIYGWLRFRVRQGKEDASRLHERLGYVRFNRQPGTLWWVHAASVGEANSALPLIEILLSQHPDHQLVMTTGTRSSARLMAKKLPPRATHLFAPVDTPQAVKRFLERIRPDTAIWVESEFWPNMILQTYKRGIPLWLVNARMSATSAARWQRRVHLLQEMMACFTACFASTHQDKARFHALGFTQMQDVGNLKYDAKPLQANPQKTSDVMNAIGDRRVWLAASTHEGEEAMIGAAHRKIKEVFPDILTLLVPRHPTRAQTIATQLTQQKLTLARRSKKQFIVPETDIYLADTLGELGLFYRLAEVVFVGGSLVPVGGHNLIEPAQLDCAIIVGRYMYHFEQMCRAMQDANALVQIKDADALAETVIDLLRHQEKQEQLAKNAHHFVDTQGGASAAIGAVITGQALPQADKADA